MAQIPKSSSRDKPKTTKRPPTTASTRSKAKRSVKADPAPLPEITPEQRRQMIEEAAYMLAEKRGFSDGDPMSDWFAAEKDIDRLLTERAAQPAQ